MRIDEPTLDLRLASLPGWSGSTSSITKQFRFADFAKAMEFVNGVAQIAELLNHHPDITIAWNRVTLTITSHSQGGVTNACLDLAQGIDGLGNANHA